VLELAQANFAATRFDVFNRSYVQVACRIRAAGDTPHDHFSDQLPERLRQRQAVLYGEHQHYLEAVLERGRG
jgi:hypothetical protein